MAYIGSSPLVGDFKKLDDISSQFNSSNTVFTVTSGGAAVSLGSAQSVLVSLGNVILEPETAYSLANSGSAISFTTPPDAATSFFAIKLGSVGQVVVPGDGTITTVKVADNAITSAKIADGTILASDIADSNITAAKILNGAVTGDKLDISAVTTTKILDEAVTTAKIAAANVTTSLIADNAIITSKIAAANITTSLIADNAITNDKILDGTIGDSKLVSPPFSTGKAIAMAIVFS